MTDTSYLDSVRASWDAHFRTLLEESRAIESEAVGEVLAEMVNELRRELLAEMARAIKLAFLERGGWQPRIRGTWVEGEQYQALDLVARDGTVWLCKCSSPGPCPGEDWQLVSQRGERGRIGPIGLRGEQGPPGPPGEPAQRIIGWVIDAIKYIATPTMSDGTLGAPLRLRELFRQFDDEVRGVAPAAKIVEAEAPRRAEAAPIVRVLQGPPPAPGVVE